MAKRLCSFDEDWKQLTFVVCGRIQFMIGKGGGGGISGQDTASCTIDVSDMGRSAIYSHAKGAKHVTKVSQCKQSYSINFFCQSLSAEKEETTITASPNH